MSEKNSEDEKIVKVHAYIAGFLPDLIIGFQKDGIWYLPSLNVNGLTLTAFPRFITSPFLYPCKLP